MHFTFNYIENQQEISDLRSHQPRNTDFQLNQRKTFDSTISKLLNSNFRRNTRHQKVTFIRNQETTEQIKKIFEWYQLKKLSLYIDYIY